jgi:hypothetical protein
MYFIAVSLLSDALAASFTGDVEAAPPDRTLMPWQLLRLRVLRLRAAGSVARAALVVGQTIQEDRIHA